MVATDLVVSGKDAPIAVMQSRRMLDAANRVSLSSEWYRYLPRRPDRRLRIRFGSLEGILARPPVSSKANVVGFSMTVDRFMALQREFPEVNFLAIRALQDNSSSKQSTEVSSTPSLAFAFATIASLVRSEESSPSVTGAQDESLALVRSRLDALNRDRKNNSPIERELAVVTSLLDGPPLSEEDRRRWAKLQQQLGDAYFDPAGNRKSG
jgi:hypothetical protein